MSFFALETWKGKAPESDLPKCGACGLYKGCNSPKMPVTGHGHRKVLFVAEAPGEQEDKHGEQLVGDAGQCLREILMDIGVDLDDCWKTQAVICAPKGGLKELHVESCRPTLLNTIRELKPKVIILLGQAAANSLLSTEWTRDGVGPVTRWVGMTIPSKKYGAWLCPTYPPGFILRTGEDPTLIKIMRGHLKRAIKLEAVAPDPLDLAGLKKEIQVVIDPMEVRNRMFWLNQQRGVLAFDYETTGKKPEAEGHRIVSVAFTLEDKGTWALLIKPSHKAFLSNVLQNPKLAKVASNLKFEERWTQVKLGHGVANWHWDTMLAAHQIDNRRGVTGLKYQVYTGLGVADYDDTMGGFLRNKRGAGANAFNRIDEAPVEDLLLYNGLDALLEYRLCLKQKALMGMSHA